jgi:FlaA1/EpsC-like NDP-sugar epimerase
MRAIAKNRIYIIGAGLTGLTLAREIQAKPILGRVVAFLDDDPQKIGRRLNGVPVLGPLDAVAELLKTTPADEAIIAIPGATREQLLRVYGLLSAAEFSRIRIVPQLSQLLSGEPHLIQARELNPEDLLARQPVRVDLKKSLAYLRGQRVLVTGAGGSIGSELARQLLYGGAERLFLFGHGENSIYEAERELRLLQEAGVGEKAAIVPVIGELQDRDYMRYIVGRLRANVVFHAAAHKHVPLMEANPVEAVKNNVFGTANLIDASLEGEVERFVLVSTDKAVEPASVYGASKLIAEELVLRQAGPGRAFLVVRFGNVLGSRGSILPLFSKQIQKGGPVTLTHPEARRFFMTIPEAVSLVLQAGGVGRPRGLYLLDMGEPVLIRELAEQMIRLYYGSGSSIPVVYTGLRPGEKLQERLWAEGDSVQPTECPKLLLLERKYALNGKLNAVLDSLRPICFFREDSPQAYRNRRMLRETLKRIIPDLRLPDDEPPY